MEILKFKQFESSSNGYNYPSLQDIENYFQDFTDEVDGKLYDYKYGFKFYLKDYTTSTGYEKTLSDKSNYTDILNTDIEDKKLTYLSDYVFINDSRLYKDTILNSIKNGAKAYKYLMITFDYYNTLFYKSQLDLLIECLKRLYHNEGFRPYGTIWTEDCVNPNTNIIEEKLGFQGLLVNCSDEEYIKMYRLMDQQINSNVLFCPLKPLSLKNNFNSKFFQAFSNQVKHFI